VGNYAGFVLPEPGFQKIHGSTVEARRRVVVRVPADPAPRWRMFRAVTTGWQRGRSRFGGRLMRLHRLDHTRYGIFIGHSIDFGSRRPGEPDLHIIYGPNEAGKSTSLAAFLDLLFRIEKNSRYDFHHPYATMRIGAALEISGRMHEFARIKRDQRSLLNGADDPVAEEVILAELGGIERGAYRTMFSLDDDTLEAGGESILASKGDLGELLFAASAGLADLSRTLRVRPETTLTIA